MRVQHNINALNAYRQLGVNNSQGSKSLEKLSSGFRINRAGDDAAGLAISEKMRGQIRGLDMASKNAQDGISLLQTAEGALQETHSILQRMRELTVQGANDTNQDVDRDAIKTELNELSEEVKRIADNTEFNKKTLLNGTFGVELDTSAGKSTLAAVSGVSKINLTGVQESSTITFTNDGAGIVTATDTVNGVTQEINLGAAAKTGTVNFDKLGVSIELKNADTTIVAGTVDTTAQTSKFLQIGANEDQKLGVKIGNMSDVGLGVTKADLNVDTYANAQVTLTSVEKALNDVSAQRSSLGAWQNRLEHTITNLITSAENLTAAESRIRDVDMAKEMMEFTKNNILSQAAQAMLAQANQQPQAVLQLLQ